MKITFVPTGLAPDRYSFSGDTVTAHRGSHSEAVDLSALQEGDSYQGILVDGLISSHGSVFDGQNIVRDAYRDSSGELHVTLCQQVGPGFWTPGEEIPVEDYDPKNRHIGFNTTRRFSGIPFVVTDGGVRLVPREVKTTMWLLQQVVDASGGTADNDYVVED